LLSTWVPWFFNAERPIFSFYAIAILPFTIIALSLLMGTLIGGPRASERRRAWGTAAAGAFVVLVLVNFVWFWPIYTGELISTPEWLARIWFRQWI
jgi:dolichyl-phosphate-mannose-protein mannosyltransferase